MKRFLPSFMTPKRNDNSLAVASMVAMKARLKSLDKQIEVMENAIEDMKSTRDGIIKAIDRIVESEL